MDDRHRQTVRARFDESTIEAAISMAKDRTLSPQDRRHAAEVAAFILRRARGERLVAEAMRHVSASLDELLVIRRLLRAPSETAGSVASAIEDMPESSMRVRLARAYVELLERERQGRRFVKRQETPAPFAITSQGEVLVNVDAFSSMPNPGSLLELVREEGGTVFVGVPISNGELRDVAFRLDDALAEAAARLVAKRQRRPRGKVRKKARSAS